MYKKICIIIISVVIIIFNTGCETKINENPAGNNNAVAVSGLGCLISIYNNEFHVNKNDAKLDFSMWKNIKSISANSSFLGGIKEDGSAVVVSNSGLEIGSVTDWKDIKTIGFTAVAVIGLKNDGTVIFSFVEDIKINSSIYEKIKAWKDIDIISTSYFGIIGIKRNGEVIAAFDDPEIEEKVMRWKDIKAVSISTSGIRTRIIGQKYNGEFEEVRSDSFYKFQLDSYDNIKNAGKFCAGDLFTAGLMPDGTLKVNCGYDYQQMIYNKSSKEYSDLNALNGLKEVIDINSDGDVLAVLMSDGRVLAGGIEQTD